MPGTPLASIAGGSGGGEIVGGGLAGPLVLDDLVAHLLAFIQAIEARTLDGGDMDEYVRTTLVRLNEAITFLAIEPLNGASCHNARSLVQSLLVAGPAVHPAGSRLISKYRKMTSAMANGIRVFRSVGRNIR